MVSVFYGVMLMDILTTFGANKMKKLILIFFAIFVIFVLYKVSIADNQRANINNVELNIINSVCANRGGVDHVEISGGWIYTYCEDGLKYGNKQL